MSSQSASIQAQLRAAQATRRAQQAREGAISPEQGEGKAEKIAPPGGDTEAIEREDVSGSGYMSQDMGLQRQALVSSSVRLVEVVYHGEPHGGRCMRYAYGDGRDAGDANTTAYGLTIEKNTPEQTGTIDEHPE